MAQMAASVVHVFRAPDVHQVAARPAVAVEKAVLRHIYSTIQTLGASYGPRPGEAIGA